MVCPEILCWFSKRPCALVFPVKTLLHQMAYEMLDYKVRNKTSLVGGTDKKAFKEFIIIFRERVLLEDIDSVEN
jgi:hypothetical protein